MVAGIATTLNDADSLMGGTGHDILALYGPGTYHIDQLAAFTDFDEVQLIKDTSTLTDIVFGDDVALDIISSGQNNQFTIGANANVSIQAEDARNISIGDGSSSTIDVSAGSGGTNNTFSFGTNSTVDLAVNTVGSEFGRQHLQHRRQLHSRHHRQRNWGLF